jgi:hypothetical protein
MLDIVKAHGPSSRGWNSCTCPRLSVAAFRTMLELVVLGPLLFADTSVRYFASQNPETSQTPSTRTLAQRFPCGFQQGKLLIHCMGDSSLSSFGFIEPSPGCLSALPVTPLQAAFLVEALQTNPDPFTGTTQRLRSYDSYTSSIDSATATLAADPNARNYNGAR